MPSYRYRNLTTNEIFDLEQRITESALTEHPETGDPVKRLIQPVGIAFKGSGFYVNDSRASNKPAGTKEGKTDTKADTKTDSKADTGKSDKADSGKKADSKPPAKSEKSDKSGSA